MICRILNDHNCQTETNKCLLYGHEQYIPLQSCFFQVFVVKNGIACDVIGSHDKEIYRELFINRTITTPTPIDSSKCIHTHKYYLY